MAQRVYFCVNASISGHLRRVSASVSCPFIAFALFVLFRVISWIVLVFSQLAPSESRTANQL